MNRPQPKVERAGTVTVITFTAGAVRDVENVIARELEGHTGGDAGRHLLLDFTNVRCLNSVELGTLISLHKKAAAGGGRLTLFNLNDQLRELFAVTRLDTLLAVCREDEAPAGCRPE